MIFENHSNLIGLNVDVEHWLCSRSWSYYCGPGREHGPDLQSFLHVCRLEGWGGGVLDEPSLHFPSGQQWTESSAVSSFLSLGVSMMFDTSSRRLLAGLLAVTNVWTSLPAAPSAPNVSSKSLLYQNLTKKDKNSWPSPSITKLWICLWLSAHQMYIVQ